MLGRNNGFETRKDVVAGCRWVMTASLGFIYWGTQLEHIRFWIILFLKPNNDNDDDRWRELDKYIFSTFTTNSNKPIVNIKMGLN